MSSMNPKDWLSRLKPEQKPTVETGSPMELLTLEELTEQMLASILQMRPSFRIKERVQDEALLEDQATGMTCLTSFSSMYCQYAAAPERLNELKEEHLAPFRLDLLDTEDLENFDRIRQYILPVHRDSAFLDMQRQQMMTLNGDAFNEGSLVVNRPVFEGTTLTYAIDIPDHPTRAYVSNKLLEYWGVGEQELYKIGMKNLLRPGGSLEWHYQVPGLLAILPSDFYSSARLLGVFDLAFEMLETQLLAVSIPTQECVLITRPDNKEALDWICVNGSEEIKRNRSIAVTPHIFKVPF